MARTSTQIWNGCRIYHFVFGKYPNLRHGRHTFTTESDASLSIRRALRTNVRTAKQIYENGDIVLYKREGKVRWLEQVILFSMMEKLFC